MSGFTKVLWVLFGLALLKPPEDMGPVLLILVLAILATLADRYVAVTNSPKS